MCTKQRAFSLGLMVLLLSLVACDGDSVGPAKPFSTTTSNAESRPTMAEAQTSGVRSFESEMLDVAFQAVAQMPSNPHEKNRSRGQWEIVEACLHLDYPAHALKYGKKISNWRQAQARAAYALYCAKLGWTKEAHEHLDIVLSMAQKLAQDENEQAWRIDRIRSLSTEAELVLASDAAQAGVAHAGTQKMIALDLALATDAQFAAFIEEVNRTFRSEEFSAVEKALDHCVVVFGQFYANAERRDQLYQMVKESYPRLPMPIRIRLLSDLAAATIDPGDAEFGKKVAAHISSLIEGGRWRPQDEVAVRARQAVLWHKLGDERKAEAELDGAKKLYEQKRLAIVSIFRGLAVRPLAESFMLMGNHAEALRLYAHGLDEAMENPNSRPRVMDLVQTCISMAIHHCQWSPELREKVETVAKALGDPW